MKRYLIEKKGYFLINVILMVLNYLMFWIKLKIILKN